MSILPPKKRERSKKRGKGNAGGPAFPTERIAELKTIKQQPQKRNERNEGNKEREEQKKTRRGKPRKNALMKFKVMLNNIRGLKTKETMMKRIVLEEKPVLYACVETKLNKDDAVEIPGYEISRVNRDEDGGGVLLV